MLGIAVELHKRGHEVTFLANGYFQETVERFGLRFVELGSREHYHAVASDPDLWNPRRAFRYVFQRAVQPILRGQYTAIEEHSRSQETVVVANCLGFGARIAHERLGVPLVTIHIQPAVILSHIEPPAFPRVVGPRWLKGLLFGLAERLVIDRTVCPEVNRFRRELGLPPVRKITRWWHSPQRVLCVFPEWFASPQPDWPKNVVQTDFPLWDERTDAGLVPEVQEFLGAGEPPIVFTPGSANVFGKPFFEAAVEACQRLGRRGILLTRFPEQIPERLPVEVKHFGYIPFSQLLPKVAALVHHGGIGTTAQALAAGIPQLVMPLAHDQFDNAARVKRLGVGDWIVPSRFRGPKVAASLDALLTSEAVKRACLDVRAKSSHDGIGKAADAIEELATRVFVSEHNDVRSEPDQQNRR
jgi:rhamnosyltransferase subunit B